MAPETYLSVLTFLGLVVGFGSGLISQLKRTSNDVPGSNEKKLTSFGKLALGISLVGFAGSFASALLSGAVSAQHAKDARSQQEEETKWKARSTDLASEILRNTKSALEDSLQTRFAIAETRQKVLNDNLLRETRLYGRITAAGAPLTSMQITLVVEQVPADVREQIRKGESNAFYKVHHDWPYVRDWIPLTSAEETSAAQSIVDQEFIPKFISFLISDKFRNDQSVLGLCLDRHFSSVLSVGWITRPDAFEMESGKSLAPSGIRIESDPPVKRKKTSPPEVHIGLEKDAVVLTLELAADSLDDGVVRYLLLQR